MAALQASQYSGYDLLHFADQYELQDLCELIAQKERELQVTTLARTKLTRERARDDPHAMTWPTRSTDRCAQCGHLDDMHYHRPVLAGICQVARCDCRMYIPPRVIDLEQPAEDSSEARVDRNQEASG
jgi:hypothetical protein